MAQQVCIIYAVTKGYLNDLDVDQIAEFEKQLEETMDNHYPQVLTTIRETGKMDEETENALKTALTELVNQLKKA